jgi:hypothetical protein
MSTQSRESGRFFDQKQRKNLCFTGPVPVKQARPKSTKLFAVFVHKKQSFLGVRNLVTPSG